MKCFILALLALATGLTSGCVTGRRTVGLTVVTIPPAAIAKGDAVILEVVDHRTFENKPKDPATPSIDGDVTSLTAEAKSSMIGRQRNTYGKAMGDIALPAGQSVPQQVRALVAESLKAAGYNVGDNPGAPLKLKVQVNQFWAWFTPGMFSLTFEARVYCGITIEANGKTTEMLVQGYGRNPGQFAKDVNWKEAYDRAYRDFQEKLGAELRKAGL